jgi:hypothetical protein
MCERPTSTSLDTCAWLVLAWVFAIVLVITGGGAAWAEELGTRGVASTMEQQTSTTDPAHNGTPTALARDCLRDLEAIPAFLLANDAGMQQPATPDELAKRQAALEAARRGAAGVQDDGQCTAVLQTYLRAWRRGHLFVHAVKANEGRVSAPAASMPMIEMLSPTTALITVPSFFNAAHAPLTALIEQHRQELQARPNWIVDVRGNGGGSDITYAPLLPWLMADGWIDVSERVFVTPTNVQAEERIAQEMAPGDAESARITAAIVQRMRAGQEGGWVQQQYDAGWQYQPPDHVVPRRPQRVAVLMDAGCGSSCEQFLLTVRQSFAVKLVGHRRSFGGLDASNLRPHLLPSGRQRLWYATTVSNRLPALPIDGIGVEPDVLLPYPEDQADRRADVTRTQQWLEGGGWPPAKH